MTSTCLASLELLWRAFVLWLACLDLAGKQKDCGQCVEKRFGVGDEEMPGSAPSLGKSEKPPIQAQSRGAWNDTV